MADLKIKAKIDAGNLTRIVTRLEKLINKNIEVAVRSQAIPHLIDLIMKGYDEISRRADMGPEDPTNPSLWRQEFLERLQTDLEQTFRVANNIITVNLGERKFLGYTPVEETDPDDDSPLVWLVYYIEGLAGDWAFISPADYERFRGAGKYNPKWGRFGQGFMISKEEYEAEGWQRIIPFDQVRHPFSGFAPIDIFTEAVREFTLKPFIDKAIKAAMRGERL